jgi:hypothetical protein
MESKKLDVKIETHEHKTVKETVTIMDRCSKYNELCNKKKLCGDCALDDYERKQYEEAVSNFNLDRKMSNYKY